MQKKHSLKKRKAIFIRLMLVLLLPVSFVFAQNVKATFLELNDVYYPITDICLSNTKDKLLISQHGSRFCLYDVKGKEKIENTIALLWKNFTLNDFNYGTKCTFSSNDEYILVREWNSNASLKRVKGAKIAVLKASDGSVVFEKTDINSAHFTKENNLFLCYDEYVEVFDFMKNITLKKVKLENAEVAALSSDGKIMAASFDAERRQMKLAESVGNNRAELKKALKTKKMIQFFSFPEGNPVAICNDEVDVVFDMEFSENNDYLYFFSRNYKLDEHQNTTAGINALGRIDETRNQSNFQRVKVADFTLDNKNFYQTSGENFAKYKLRGNYFLLNDNEGFLGFKRRTIVSEINNSNTILSSFKFQSRPSSKNLFPCAFELYNSSTSLVSNGRKIGVWNFLEQRNYIDYYDSPEANELIDKAQAQLTSDLENPESKLLKNITKAGINGLYLFDITVTKKGNVTGIFTQSDEKTNIKMQNALKDILLQYQFNDVEVPKNERLKFQYSFNL